MDSTTEKETSVPSQGVPQGTAEISGIVPARASSSSYVGLAKVSSADSFDQWQSAENDNDQGNEKGNDYGIRKDGEEIMEKEAEKESQETNFGSQDTVLMDLKDQVRPSLPIPAPDESMDMLECRKRGRDKSPEEEDEEEGVKPSQKLRRARVRVLRDSPDVAQQQQEQVRTMCHIDISDNEDDVEFVMESGGKHDIGDEDDVVKEVKRGRGRPRKDRRTVMGVKEIGVREYSGSENEEGFNQLSASEMGATAVVYVEKVDAIRKTCGNIKGSLSGEMKKKLQDTREIIKALVRRCDKRKDERGEEEEVRKLKKKNKELIEELREKDTDIMKRLEEIGRLHETVQELKSELGRMRKMEKDMEKMQDRIKELEQNSPKRKKIPRGSDADIESDATICSVNMKSIMDWYPTTDNDTRCSSPQPGCSWMPDLSLKKKKVHPGPGAMTLEKKRELVEKTKANREKIKKEGTLGKVKLSKEKEEPERAWPMLPPPSTATPLPQKKPRDRMSEMNKETETTQTQKVKLKPGFKLIENRIIKPGFRITRDKSTQSRNTQEGKSLENTGGQSEWRENKSKKQKRRERRETEIKEMQMKGKESRSKETEMKGRKQVRRRPPRSAAVIIKVTEDFTYAQALRKAREKISLEQIGIEKTRIRKTATGNLLIEIPGVDRSNEAEKLAAELRNVLEGVAYISRPTIKGEIRIFGIDDSITKEEIVDMIAKEGKCKHEEIRIGEMKTMRNGLGMIWAQCPLTSAIALNKIQKIRVGWSTLKIELLNARETQCFKCWRFGHIKSKCTSTTDRRGLCYKCSGSGHLVKNCTNAAYCIICKDANKNPNHRLGSAACIQNREKKESETEAKDRNIEIKDLPTKKYTSNEETLAEDKMEIVTNE